MRRAASVGTVAGVTMAWAAMTGAMAEEKTESALTVERGVRQLETKVGFARGRRADDGSFTETYEYGTTTIRVGATNSVELGAVWQPWGVVRTRSEDPDIARRRSGMGGLDVRAKVNLRGNDDFGDPGSIALALIPFVSSPTDRRKGISPDFVGGGILIPFAVQLTEMIELGLNAGAARLKDDDASGYRTEYIGAAAFRIGWTDRLVTYHEVVATHSRAAGVGEAVLVGNGVSYAIGDDVQLDAGVDIGVTPAADRFNPVIQITVRF